jgi:hypothetical protein
MSAINFGLSVSLSQITATSSINQLQQQSAIQATSQEIDLQIQGDTQSISPAGQFFSQLQGLQQNSPGTFQDLLKNISTQLQAAAKQVGADTQQGQFLTSLANAFQSVADGGALSQLQPGGGGHHHHLQQAFAIGQQSTQQTLQDVLNSTGPSGSSDTSSTNGQSLFDSILQQIAQAAAAFFNQGSSSAAATSGSSSASAAPAVAAR